MTLIIPYLSNSFDKINNCEIGRILNKIGAKERKTFIESGRYTVHIAT
jgi:hypothetical protein